MANDQTYSDEQREEVRARLQRFQDEQKAINDQIPILKGRYSNQIYQIRESIMKFLDKETSTLGERIRTLFKEQGLTIVSILTAIGMAIGVLIEALPYETCRAAKINVELPLNCSKAVQFNYSLSAAEWETRLGCD